MEQQYLYKDKDWLFNKLHKEELSYKTVGKICGVSDTTIKNYAIAYGIPREKKPSPLQGLTKEWINDEYHLKGRSTKDIAKELKTDEKKLIKWIKDNDVGLKRPKKESVDKRYKDPEFLRQMIEVEGKTYDEVAELCGVTYHQVHHWIRTYQIKNPKGQAKIRAMQIAETSLSNKDWLQDQFIFQNKTPRQISEEIGVDRGTVQNWVQRHGLIKKDALPPGWERPKEFVCALPGCDNVVKVYKHKGELSNKRNKSNAFCCCLSHATLYKFMFSDIGEKIMDGHFKFFETDEGIRKRSEAGVKAVLANQNKKGETRIEKKLREYLDAEKISYFSQYVMGTWVVDFYLPEVNTVIETHGDFWHANPNKYDGNNLRPQQKLRLIRDKGKTKYLNEKGFRLLVLWEDDIMNQFEECVEKIKELFIK